MGLQAWLNRADMGKRPNRPGTVTKLCISVSWAALLRLEHAGLRVGVRYSYDGTEAVLHTVMSMQALSNLFIFVAQPPIFG